MLKTAFLDAGSLDRDDLDLQPLREATGGALHLFPRTHPEAVVPRLAGMDAVIVNKVVLDADILARVRGLRLIAVAATGVNNVDTHAAQERGVAVCNCRGYGTDSVAQHALALMLNHFTRIPALSGQVAEGHWSRSPHFCLIDPGARELAGKRLGIVGYGTLGARFAELAEALGMEVWIAERPGAHQGGAAPGRRPFQEVLQGVDVLSLHCPLTETTHKLIDHAALQAMRSDALLINTARGALVDEQALADALRSGWIGGAAIDVLSEEPPPAGHPLLAGDIPNLAITPHSAWSSVEARQRIVDQLAEALGALASGEPLPRAIVAPEP